MVLDYKDQAPLDEEMLEQEYEYALKHMLSQEEIELKTKPKL